MIQKLKTSSVCLLLILGCIAVVAIATVVGTKAFKSNADESNELLMANVEALTDGESNSPCNNVNGYRSWALTGFLKPKREFYDCCYKLQEGYSPKDNCR